MIENKRLKINKRQKQSLAQMNYLKQMSIEQAYQMEKLKSFNLKQRNQKLQTKCRLLYQKLYTDNQNPDEIFAGLNQQIWQNDKKIKEIQEQLYFRYSKQMNKLKKKVKNFFEYINFDIDFQDLDKLTDQIDIILLLIDLFQVKYDQMMTQNEQIEELIRRIKEPEIISGTAQKVKDLEEQLQFYLTENNHLKQSIKQLERQVTYLQREFDDFKSIQSLKGNGQNLQINRTVQKMRAKINQLESQKTIKDIEIQKRNKRIIELQNEIQHNQKRLLMISEQQERNRKDQLRWKQRFTLMEEQKNERIKLLEKQLSRKIST